MHRANTTRCGVVAVVVLQAESMYCRLVSCKAKLYGANHLSTLTSICNLATVLYDNGKLRGASDNLICAMAGYSYLLGPGHETGTHAVPSYPVPPTPHVYVCVRRVHGPFSHVLLSSV